ncbi:hypothetical protein BH09SUM1_BH09SUM1_26680 [soil metagenome]
MRAIPHFNAGQNPRRKDWKYLSTDQISTRVEARFFEPGSWDGVSCRLCPALCSIAPSRSGACGVRTNRGGKLYVDLYGKTASREILSADELPLFHYKPDLSWLRVGGKGCTMRCPFCNTYKFSQSGAVRTAAASVDVLVMQAIEGGARGISFGVSEPAPMHEFIFDVFTAARAAGLETHIATSGMWSTAALRELAPLVTAATIGLKGFDNDFYQRIVGGDLPTVIGNIDLLMTIGVHLEISWVVIPGRTDHPSQPQLLFDVLDKHDSKPTILLLPYEPDFAWKSESHAATEPEMLAFRGAFSSYAGWVYDLHPLGSGMNTRCKGCSRTLVRRGVARQVTTTDAATGKRSKTCACGLAAPYVVE